MKNKKHLAFLGAILAFVIVMASGVWLHENLRTNGQQVILATVPVDPRDILRGDYVDLAYEIGRGDEAVAFAKTVPESGPVYTILTLGPDNRVTDYSFSLTEPDEGIYIRGEVYVQEVDIYTEVGDRAPIITKEKQ